MDRGEGRDPDLRRVSLPVKEIDARESLMSIVHRTADRSEMTPGSIILSAGYPHRQTFNMAVTDLDRIPALAYVVRQPEEEIRARTYPETFRSPRGCTFVDFAGASIPLALLNVRTRTVAPAALEERPFHHLLSEHRLLPFDADTGTMLVSNCPECGARLGWTVVRSFCRCKCGADLRSIAPTPVPPEFLDGATIMAKLLDPRLETHGEIVESLPAALRGLNRGNVFEIGWQTAIAIGLAERPNANAANWSDGQKMRSLDLAARLLADWPTSAEAAFASLPSTERRRRAVTDLAALARSTRIPEEARAGIRDILPERSPSTRAVSSGRPHGVNLTDEERRARRDAYAPTTGDGSLVGRDVATSVSINQTCHIFGKSVADTSRMLRTLDPVDTFGAHKRRTRWKRDDVVRIADLLSHRDPIDSFSRRSGIPHHGIEQMICMGHIDQIDDPAVVAGHKVRQLDRRSIRALAERLASNSAANGAEGWLSLTEAMKAVGGREKPWGPAFAMMLVGVTLPFTFRVAGDGAGIVASDILVPAHARDLLSAAMFSKDDHPRFTFDDHVTIGDAATLLNVPENKFSRIRSEHFAKDVAPDGRLAVSAVIDAAREWVSPGELGARTGRTAHDCFTELAKTNLPRTLLGWPRGAAEEALNLAAGALR